MHFLKKECDVIEFAVRDCMMRLYVIIIFSLYLEKRAPFAHKLEKKCKILGEALWIPAHRVEHIPGEAP